MDLRSIASLSFACLALAGCALMLPDALRENETVTIESSMPAAGSRVPAGMRIEIRVKYRIDPFVPGQKYYLIACNLDNCRSRPEYAKEITTAKGRETIAFPLHSEGGLRSGHTRRAADPPRLPKPIRLLGRPQCARNRTDHRAHRPRPLVREQRDFVARRLDERALPRFFFLK